MHMHMHTYIHTYSGAIAENWITLNSNSGCYTGEVLVSLKFIDSAGNMGVGGTYMYVYVCVCTYIHAYMYIITITYISQGHAHPSYTYLDIHTKEHGV